QNHRLMSFAEVGSQQGRIEDWCWLAGTDVALVSISRDIDSANGPITQSTIYRMFAGRPIEKVVEQTVPLGRALYFNPSPISPIAFVQLQDADRTGRTTFQYQLLLDNASRIVPVQMKDMNDILVFDSNVHGIFAGTSNYLANPSKRSKATTYAVDERTGTIYT